MDTQLDHLIKVKVELHLEQRFDRLTNLHIPLDLFSSFYPQVLFWFFDFLIALGFLVGHNYSPMKST